MYDKPWTKKLPTEEGLYWCVDEGKDRSIMLEILFLRGSKRFVALLHGSKPLIDVEKHLEGRWWSGPYPTKEPPK